MAPDRPPPSVHDPSWPSPREPLNVAAYNNMVHVSDHLLKYLRSLRDRLIYSGRLKVCPDVLKDENLPKADVAAVCQRPNVTPLLCS